MREFSASRGKNKSYLCIVLSLFRAYMLLQMKTSYELTNVVVIDRS
jgi:hypothetical protein